MKFLKFSFIVLAFLVLLSSCGGGNISSSDMQTVSTEKSDEDSERDAVYALYKYFGTEDKETGTAYSFSITDTLTIDGSEYYHGRWSVLSSEEDGTVINSSLLHEFFLKKDLTVFYKGSYDYAEKKANFESEPINISK